MTVNVQALSPGSSALQAGAGSVVNVIPGSGDNSRNWRLTHAITNGALMDNYWPCRPLAPRCLPLVPASDRLPQNSCSDSALSTMSIAGYATSCPGDEMKHRLLAVCALCMACSLAQASPAPADGIDRIWPGYFAPVMIRDFESGERIVVPMRYRCRLPGWTEADEIEKPGTYDARRDKLSTVWRKVFGYNHGLMVVDRFYESVYLHDLQKRPLVPGEREQNVEILFTPSTGENLFVACLWTYVEAAGDDPGFYTAYCQRSDRTLPS